MPGRYRGTEKAVYGPMALLERRDMAAHIAAIATQWVSIEELWGILLAAMLHAEAKIGVEMYLALTGATSQATVLKAVAQERLTDPLRARFEKLLIEQRSRANERNTVVHGRWGILPSKTDRLVVRTRDWTTRAQAALNEAESRNPFPATSALAGAFPSPPISLPPMETFAYVERDFLGIVTRLAAHSDRLWRLIQDVEEAAKRRASEIEIGRQLQWLSLLPPAPIETSPEEETPSAPEGRA